MSKSLTLKQHHERRKKCFAWAPLQDGQQIVFALPAFDLRGTKDETYGQHSVEIIFAERRGNVAVSVTFYTGITVSGERTIMHGKDIGLMCTGLYTHFRYKKDAPDYSHDNSNDECPYLSASHCYGEMGSSLYDDEILERFINEGSAGVWDEINQQFAEALKS